MRGILLVGRLNQTLPHSGSLSYRSLTAGEQVNEQSGRGEAHRHNQINLGASRTWQDSGAGLGVQEA